VPKTHLESIFVKKKQMRAAFVACNNLLDWKTAILTNYELLLRAIFMFYGRQFFFLFFFQIIVCVSTKKLHKIRLKNIISIYIQLWILNWNCHQENDHKERLLCFHLGVLFIKIKTGSPLYDQNTEAVFSEYPLMRSRCY
jgi:hypothetical protein